MSDDDFDPGMPRWAREEHDARKDREAREQAYARAAFENGLPELRLAVMEGGALVDLNERERDDELERLDAEKRAQRHEQNRIEREAEAAERRALEDAKLEREHRESGYLQRLRAWRS